MTKTYENHVILGAGGAISYALVPELLRQKQNVTLVSRSGRSRPGAQSATADAMDYQSLSSVVPENSVVYMLIGLPYKTKVWQETWPALIDNVIRVCSEKNALLVFFDNVYVYGPVDGPMTEDTPHNPTSKKGDVRARVADAVMEAYGSGKLSGVIARSADFYGPGAEKSGVPNFLIIEKMMKGGKSQWMLNADVVHSLTFTTDCGRALPLLAADESSHNQVWHLPTAHPPITMRNLMKITAEIVDKPPKISTLSPLMLKLVGLFNSAARELPEMAYQNDRDYVFDSTKFETHFSFAPTSYKHGVAETVQYYRGAERNS